MNKIIKSSHYVFYKNSNYNDIKEDIYFKFKPSNMSIKFVDSFSEVDYDGVLMLQLQSDCDSMHDNHLFIPLQKNKLHNLNINIPLETYKFTYYKNRYRFIYNIYYIGIIEKQVRVIMHIEFT